MTRAELEWNPRCRAMEKLTDGPVGVGTRYRAKWKGSPHVELETCLPIERLLKGGCAPAVPHSSRKEIGLEPRAQIRGITRVEKAEMPLALRCVEALDVRDQFFLLGQPECGPIERLEVAS